MGNLVDTFSKINGALGGPGPVTDRSTHTTSQLPPHPMSSAPGSGAIHTGTKGNSLDGDWSALRAGKNGPKPY